MIRGAGIGSAHRGTRDRPRCGLVRTPQRAGLEPGHAGRPGLARPHMVHRQRRPAVADFADDAAGGATDPTEVAVRLFHAVRDGFRYDPYNVDLRPRARSGPARSWPRRRTGACPKSVLLTAAARHRGHPGPPRLRRRPQPPDEREAQRPDGHRPVRLARLQRVAARGPLVQAEHGVQHRAVRAVRRQAARLRRHRRRPDAPVRQGRQPPHGVRQPARQLRRPAARADPRRLRRDLRLRHRRSTDGTAQRRRPPATTPSPPDPSEQGVDDAGEQGEARPLRSCTARLGPPGGDGDPDDGRRAHITSAGAFAAGHAGSRCSLPSRKASSQPRSGGSPRCSTSVAVAHGDGPVGVGGAQQPGRPAWPAGPAGDGSATSAASCRTAVAESGRSSTTTRMCSTATPSTAPISLASRSTDTDSGSATTSSSIDPAAAALEDVDRRDVAVHGADAAGDLAERTRAGRAARPGRPACAARSGGRAVLAHRSSAGDRNDGVARPVSPPCDGDA